MKENIKQMYREQLAEYIEEHNTIWDKPDYVLCLSEDRIMGTVDTLYKTQYEWLEYNYPELIIKYLDSIGTNGATFYTDKN